MVLNKKINLSKVCLGTAQFGSLRYSRYSKKKIKIKELRNILIYSKKKKIKFLDTAIEYKGVSNNLALTNFDLSYFNIITKIPKPKKGEKKYSERILSLLDQDLRILKLKKYHTILLHNCKNLNKGQISQIAKINKILINNNYSKYFGISIYEDKEYYNLKKFIDIDTIQLPFNIVDCSKQKILFIKFLKKKNINLFARSIFLQGLLINDIPKILFQSKTIKKFHQKFDNFTIKNKISKIDACLNFVLNKKYFKSILIGVLSLDELKIISNVKKSLYFKYDDFNFNLSKKYIRPDLWNKKKI